jgi:HAD superfamily hydrolase (TIGR01509 family)
MTAQLGHLRVIIYDCDGVLIDSTRANQAFYTHILEHFGLPPLTPAQWEVVKPLTAVEALDRLFRDHPFREAAQEYQKTVDNTPFLPLLRPEPQVKETLARLQGRRHLAIATNRGKSLPLVLETLGLAGFFEVTVTSLEVRHPKPHPECLEKILSHFGFAPPYACYIGDSAVDQETARRAGVLFGAYRAPHLRADFHLDHHLRLLSLLGL